MKKYILGLFAISFVLTPLLSFAQVEYPDPGPYQTGCIYINNNLRYRDRDIYKSNEVSTLQDFLQSKGYLNNEPTGYFALLTLSAVRSFQIANSISATGYVGPITREKIRALTCGDLQEQVCCEIYGYGAYMIKTSSTYEMMSRNQCTTSAGFTGGGRNIVDNNYCKPTSSTTVLSPNGGETLYRGNSKMITWQDTANLNCTNTGGIFCSPSNFSYDIYLNYYHASCADICPIAVNAVAPLVIANGVYGSSYNWQVGNFILNGGNTYLPSGLYIISICRSGYNGGYGNICDASDNPFTIQ